ncbi:MAG: TetR family transcriptional regulator [Bacteroidota bacterium]
MKIENPNISTEVKIKEAARRIFLEKGFAGCSSRDIAAEAGVNVALVNYYFRSKERLFDLIFKDEFDNFFSTMVETFSSDQLNLKEKLKIFISHEIDFLCKHPDLPQFLLTELKRCDDNSTEHSDKFSKISSTGVFAEFQQAQADGKIREIDLLSLSLLVMSNCHYPFLGRGMIMSIHQINEDQFLAHMEKHKEYVSEMLINYLFINNENK